MKGIISNLLTNSGYAHQREAKLASIMGPTKALVAHYKSVTTPGLRNFQEVTQ